MKINGNIFNNRFKENDSQPSMRGDAKDESGVEYEIAAWTKTDKNGAKYLSLSVKPKEAREAAPRNEAPKSAQPKVEESDLPF